MATFILLTLFLVLFCLTNCNARLPEMDLNTVQLVKYWGYPVETHTVQTSDGYILTLHRIPHGKGNSTYSQTTDKGRPVFFLQHALVCSSSAFILNLPHQSLGFLLADAGYDVWLGNARGNTYSRKHVSRSVKSKDFWDFTFQEMGQYDLPAMIDYALNATNQTQVYYVGHSQGTLSAFTALSENMELQKKIKIFFAMGPVTKIQHVNTVIRTMALSRAPIRWFCNWFKVYEIFASNKKTKSFGKVICPWIPKICEMFLFLLNGFDKKNLNSTRTPLYLTNIPAGTSEKNLDHYFQLVNTKQLTKYDYGEAGNVKHYGTKQVPHYDISKVKLPVVLIHGENDSIVQPRDVEWTAKHLPNVLKKMMIKGYNHLDFITAIHAPRDVYNHIVNIARGTERT